MVRLLWYMHGCIRYTLYASPIYNPSSLFIRLAPSPFQILPQISNSYQARPAKSYLIFGGLKGKWRSRYEWVRVLLTKTTAIMNGRINYIDIGRWDGRRCSRYYFETLSYM